MAEADCPICESMGYRACDECGSPAWDAAPPGRLQNLYRDAFGRELCAGCEEDRLKAAPAA